MQKKPQQKPVATLDTSLRRQRRRRVIMFRRLFLFWCFLVIATSVIMLNAAPFRVKVVEVAGTRRVSAESVYKQSGIEIDESMLLIPSRSIRNKLIRRQPLIKEASLVKVVPSKVQIRVYERQPFAYITDGKLYYLIDSDRFVLEITEGIADKDKFVIMSEGLKHAKVGEQLDFPMSRELDKITQILRKPSEGSYSRVVLSKKGIKLILKDGTYALLGSGEDLEKKVALIPVIIRELKERNEPFEGLNLSTLAVLSYIKKDSAPVE